MFVYDWMVYIYDCISYVLYKCFISNILPSEISLGDWGRRELAYIPDSINIMQCYLCQVISCLILSTCNMSDNNICLYLLTTKIIILTNKAVGERYYVHVLNFNLLTQSKKSWDKSCDMHGLLTLKRTEWYKRKSVGFKREKSRLHYLLYLWSWKSLYKLSDLEFPHLWNMNIYLLRFEMSIRKNMSIT